MGTESYALGKTTLLFAEGEAQASPSAARMDDPLSLGNIEVAEITPQISYVEHYVSLKGCRRKDRDLIETKKVSVNFTFDEINSTNLQKFLYGGTVVASKMQVMRKNKIEGRAILQFNTDVGNEFLYVIPKAVLKSEGGLSLQADEWIKGQFQLEVLCHPRYKMYDNAAASLAPYGYMDLDAVVIGSPF